MRIRILVPCVVFSGLMFLPVSRAGDTPKSADQGKLDPTLSKFASMIGGTWTNDNPKFLVEFKYDWAFHKRAIRGTGFIAKGSPNEIEVEAFFGWDPVRKSVYYLDIHGGSGIFKGTGKLDGDTIVLEFETIVGAPAQWRSVGRFPDRDTYEFKIYGQKDGQWVQKVEQKLKRKGG
jgi:hypothetical protein